MSDSDNPDKSKWLHDAVSPDLVQLHSIKQVLYSGQTKFQSVDIIDSGSFGVCLVLDGKIQSSEVDEFIYHEALVHPAMLSHPGTVFIAGGGEGATLREILAHNTGLKLKDYSNSLKNCEKGLTSSSSTNITQFRSCGINLLIDFWKGHRAYHTFRSGTTSHIIKVKNVSRPKEGGGNEWKWILRQQYQLHQ